jgi:thymidylate synthase
MQQYLDLIDRVLRAGTYKPNRTEADSIASFSQHYEVDLTEGYPLLTTKALSGFRWNSLIHEFRWYLSGEAHIRNLQEETSIWDAWADDEGHLDTAYGRFWRRYPIPDDDAQLSGETWPEDGHRWTNDDGTFDQIQYVLDGLRENPNSRRYVVSAWHPANAAVSELPPCHYTFVVNVQGGRLNVHLTQRSGDVALGIPFNIAAYSLLAEVLAQRTGFELGSFGHTIVDAHIYAGKGERGEWYADNLGDLQNRLAAVDDPAGYQDVREWLLDAAPPEAEGEEGFDHVPGLLTQLTREPRDRPTIDVADKPIDEIAFEDIELSGYDPAPGLSFEVAE